MRRTNRRDASDVHSFYFTKFLEEMREKDLWYEFKKWGDVQEVFIARNKNRSGRRYGFVKFEVGDVRRLERQLDDLIVGGLKLHVNITKHGREREANSNNKYRTRIISDKSLEGVKHQGNLEGATEQQLQQMTAPTSYAKVVVTSNRKTGRRRNLTRVSPTRTISHSSVQLNIPV